MNRTIDERYLPEYSGVIRTITLRNSHLVRVEFEFWEENEEGIVYSKPYPDEELALQSVRQFLETSRKGPEGMPGVTVNEARQNVVHAKVKLFEDVVNDVTQLPDGGEGFALKNDKLYLRTLINKLKSKGI